MIRTAEARSTDITDQARTVSTDAPAAADPVAENAVAMKATAELKAATLAEAAKAHAAVAADQKNKQPIWVGAKLDNESLKILSVMPGSPAEKSVLSSGDQIHAIVGKPVSDIAGVKKILADYQPGIKLILTIKREGVERKALLPLGSSQDNADAMKAAEAKQEKK